jgi:hypothetical protein
MVTPAYIGEKDEIKVDEIDGNDHIGNIEGQLGPVDNHCTLGNNNGQSQCKQ